MKNTRICVVGLGYVGLPLALAFGKSGLETTGFDLDKNRVEQLRLGYDKNNESSKREILSANATFSSDEKLIKTANFIVVCVPTPVKKGNLPDFSYLISASKIVGKNLSKNAIVVYESTVYPGATEEICIPEIEKNSGLKAGLDFYYGYSPERINPGDKIHTIDKVVKVVSGMDKKTCETIALVYENICKVYKAQSVKAAEAAKVIENTQRDINIALVNELSIIFHKIGIETKDVLAAAKTKWNFLDFYPGLVGGHCVGVDPYYLIYKSKALGFNPKVIGAGRETNDAMAEYVASLAIEGFKEAKKELRKSKILILGLTFKENVKDTRNSKVFDIVKSLKSKGADVFIYDPVVGEKLNLKTKYDAFVFCVKHDELIKKMGLEKMKKLSNNNPVLVDVKNIFDKTIAEKKGFIYLSL